MSQAIAPNLRPLLPADLKETIAWLREDATKQFINGNVRGSSYRHALAGDLERSHRERSQNNRED
ncbi:hypothetical protein EVB78_111 [Rhizobium phage RHph_N1_15]|nr:hypothetical protein EVB77_111 [Rhizobium phage RHph_N1_10]QIG69313.1 hypothetical protein EVB78_111 [Rhizobium phage RHph_N1_15]QIG75173.1 hypothetical protein EVC15_111 [Rhizobium phage RHph_N2_6]